MSLGTAWRRALFQASGAALLAPGAIVASLVVLALGGGFGQLGALGEAFLGPSLPQLPKSVRFAGTPARRSSPVLVALGSPAHFAQTALTPAGSAPSSSAVGGQPQQHGVPGSHRPQGWGKPPGALGGGNPGGGSAPPPPTKPPPTQPPSTVIDGVVAAGTSVTKQLPGPLGRTATQTLESVGHTLDRILPPPKGSPLGGLFSQLKVP